MTVIADEKTAQTILQLQTSVRRAVGDTDSTAANNRWTDAEINEALNFEMQKMFAEWGIADASQVITSTTLSVAASADTTALPSGPDVSPIFMVEDYTTSTNPVRLEYISPLEANFHQASNQYAGLQIKRWSRFGTTIAVRPNASALTLRIWYYRPPYAFTLDASGDETDTADNHPWPVGHEEMISLGAAIRLQEVDGEIPGGRMERYQDLWFRFVRQIHFNQGPRYIRRNRRLR